MAMVLNSERRLLLLLVAVAFLLYAPTLGHGFTLDDVFLAQSTDPQGRPDPVIAGLRPPWWYFGQRYWEGTNTTTVLYRPVTILSFALTYNLIAAPLLPASAEALPQHLVNVLLHAFAVWLVWRWLRALGTGGSAALLCAGAFAVCGVHSEVVAGIVGRAELMALVFGLGGVLLYAGGRPAWAGVAFFAAFGSKESALAWAPFLVCHLLAERWLAGEPVTLSAILRTQGSRLAVALLPALALFFVLRGFATAEVAGTTIRYQENPLAFVDVGTRVRTGVMLLGYGWLLTVAPFSLSSVYGPGAFSLVTGWGDPRFLAAALGLGVWLVAALWARRRAPLLFLSAACFLGFALLTANLIFPIGTIFGERLFFAPSLGVCLLAAVLARRVAGTRLRWPALAAIGIAGAAHAAVVLSRNGAWRDNPTLFVTDAERRPHDAELQLKAAAVTANVDRVRAEAFLDRALVADPDLPTAYGLRARIALGRGDAAAAERDFRRALACPHVADSGEDERAAEDLLALLLGRGRQDDAATLAEELLARLPRLRAAHLVRLDLALGRMPADQYAPLLAAAEAQVAGDPRVRLRHLVFDCDTGGGLAGDARALAAALLAVLTALPASGLDQVASLRARLCLVDKLVAAGEDGAARPWIDGLLRMPNLPPPARQRLEGLASRGK
ncbi:MAG: hypothetical protein R3F56_00530 [Planctomycetota bacterium]